MLAQLESGHSLVTVHEHAGRHGDDRGDLAVLLDRCSKGNQGFSFQYPRVRIAKLKVCDFHFLYRVHLFHALSLRAPVHYLPANAQSLRKALRRL